MISKRNVTMPSEDVEEAALLGSVGAVRKPVTMNTLLDALKPFVSAARPRP